MSDDILLAFVPFFATVDREEGCWRWWCPRCKVGFTYGDELVQHIEEHRRGR